MVHSKLFFLCKTIFVTPRKWNPHVLWFMYSVCSVTPLWSADYAYKITFNLLRIQFIIKVFIWGVQDMGVIFLSFLPQVENAFKFFVSNWCVSFIIHIACGSLVFNMPFPQLTHQRNSDEMHLILYLFIIHHHLTHLLSVSVIKCVISDFDHYNNI